MLHQRLRHQRTNMWHPLESVLEPPIPVVHTAPAPVIKYVSPALDVTLATPSPATEDVAPAPAATFAAPAPVIDYVAPATPETVNAYVAPAPLIEYIVPSQAVFYPSFSELLPPFDINEVVAVPSDEQIMNIPIPRGVEEIMEDQTSDAPVPQTVEVQFVAVTPTPATTDATFPHEKFDEASKMLALQRQCLDKLELPMRTSFPRPGKPMNPTKLCPPVPSTSRCC